MSSTIKLQDTINFCLPYVQFRPLNIGSFNEPAISSANTVLQTILGPPFSWRWNRSVLASFNTSAATQDYQKLIADFGFLEKVSVGGYEVECKNVLGTAATTEVGRPSHCSAYLDDNAGNITLRMMPVPDAIYPVVAIYQKKPPLFTGLTNTWTPIPDEYSFVYQYGFLALALAYAEDMRSQQYSNMFKAHLLGASEGLDETQKAIFMERWDQTVANSQARSQRTQQGVQGRAI